MLDVFGDGFMESVVIGSVVLGSIVISSVVIGSVEDASAGFVSCGNKTSPAPLYPALPFPLSAPRPRELSTSWQETIASATRFSPTNA